MSNIKVFNINEDHFWRERFEKYRRDVIPFSGNRAENYSPKRFIIEDQIATFLIVDANTDEIIAFNSVYKPVHWPQTIARIFNRSFYDPAYRALNLNKTHGPGWGQKYSYNLMIDSCQKNGIKIATCTRENTGRINSINQMLKSVLVADKNWKIKEDYYLGYDAKEVQSCWHRLIYLHLEPCNDLNLIPAMTQSQYKNKFNLQAQ